MAPTTHTYQIVDLFAERAKNLAPPTYPSSVTLRKLLPFLNSKAFV
ncbi:hypothetical protein [Nostoc sp. CCY 9925]